jgi:hypothetical protein
MEGAGRLTFALRPLSRSGAETGGGTTATLFICTRVGATSRAMAEGAGGTTRALSAGAERARSRETLVAAGATTFELSAGALSVPPRETSGAGAMMLECSEGIVRACSGRTLGAGATIDESRDGAVRDLADEIRGAGGTTASKVIPPREGFEATSTAAGLTTLAGRCEFLREECKPSTGSGAGFDLRARRFATAPTEDGSLRAGASMIFAASELPRATRMV